MPIFVAFCGCPFLRLGHAEKTKYDLGKTTKPAEKITKDLEKTAGFLISSKKPVFRSGVGEKAKEEAAGARFPPFGLMQSYNIFQRNPNPSFFLLTFRALTAPWR